MTHTTTVNGYRLEQTGQRDPEAYEVYSGWELAGHVEVRSGLLRVRVPNENGDIILEASTQGTDALLPEEREGCLADAVEAIGNSRLGETANGPWIAEGEEVGDMGLVTREFDGYRLVQICGACPEAYEVYMDDLQVGYMRLRNGKFRAEFRGEVVYRASPKGDGIFAAEERDGYLEAGVRAIDEAYGKALEAI